MVRLVIRNKHRNFEDAGTNTDPEFYDNSSPRDNNVDDSTYVDATNYFIGAGIETARKTYTATTDLSEFIIKNVQEWLFWAKLYRWFFIIEKTFIILKLISDIIL